MILPHIWALSPRGEPGGIPFPSEDRPGVGMAQCLWQPRPEGRSCCQILAARRLQGRSAPGSVEKQRWVKGGAPDPIPGLWGSSAAPSPHRAPLGAPNARGQHLGVHPKPFCGSVPTPGRDTRLTQSWGRCPGRCPSPAPEPRAGVGRAGRRRRMPVAVPSGTGRMLRARLATLPSPAAPPGCGAAAASQKTPADIFPRGAQSAPAPAGAAPCSFPAWLGPSPAQEGAETAPGGATAQFGKLLAPVPTADGKALPALGGFPWLLLGPAQAGGALPSSGGAEPDTGVQEIGETFILLQK